MNILKLQHVEHLDLWNGFDKEPWVFLIWFMWLSQEPLHVISRRADEAEFIWILDIYNKHQYDWKLVSRLL